MKGMNFKRDGLGLRPLQTRCHACPLCSYSSAAFLSLYQVSSQIACFLVGLSWWSMRFVSTQCLWGSILPSVLSTVPGRYRFGLNLFSALRKEVEIFNNHRWYLIRRSIQSTVRYLYIDCSLLVCAGSCVCLLLGSQTVLSGG